MTFKRAFSYIATLTCIILILIIVPTNLDSSGAILNQILIPKQGLILKALFTPQDDIRKTIIALINQEKKEIKIATYFFTDENIANTLISAKKNGIDINIIVDPSHVTQCQHTQIYRLARAGIAVYVFNMGEKDGIFHHKFIYLKDNLDTQTFLLTGSFNLTKSAQDRNQENVIITNYSDITKQYHKQFQYLKNRSQPLTDFIKKQRIH